MGMEMEMGMGDGDGDGETVSHPINTVCIMHYIIRVMGFLPFRSFVGRLLAGRRAVLCLSSSCESLCTFG